MTGAKPAQDYGYTAIGASPSTISACRRNLTLASGMAGCGACPTTTLKWAFRHGKYKTSATADPRIYMPLAQISAWTNLWNGKAAGMQDRIRACWNSIILRVRDSSTRWNQVRGIMSATAATLLDMEWGPAKPDQWVEPTGQFYSNISSRPGSIFTKSSTPWHRSWRGIYGTRQLQQMGAEVWSLDNQVWHLPARPMAFSSKRVNSR